MTYLKLLNASNSDYSQTIACRLGKSKHNRIITYYKTTLYYWTNGRQNGVWDLMVKNVTSTMMSINNKSSYFYKLDNHILQEVQHNPYLDRRNNLRWCHCWKLNRKEGDLHCTLLATKPPTLSKGLLETSIYRTYLATVRIHICSVGPLLNQWH